MIIAVDFDGTLALGNYPHIAQLAPNRELIARLREIRAAIAPEIKIVTARGAKDGLTDDQKARKYAGQIRAWLTKYGVPFDDLSFRKEYANLYIDDQTITPHSGFSALKSTFTGNPVILTETTAIKNAETAPFEAEWYKEARLRGFNVPDVLFFNFDCIITARIHNYETPTANGFIGVLNKFKTIPRDDDFQTYLENIPKNPDGATQKTLEVVAQLAGMAHPATFFHGDLSTTNVLVTERGAYLIDPNVKHIFGSYLTDAGKAAFSLIAYEAQYQEAEKIAAELGPAVWHFAVAEGLRVCKYQPKYISIVNNISDWI
jgi:tRNA A-37 threonylcarbamoyl transferase component Bud32